MKLQRNIVFFLVLTLVLLFAGWLRTRHLVEFVEWPDEIWSVWHVRGTFPEAMSRVAYDWPPLFSVATWAGMQAVGQQLEPLRYLMVLIALLSVAVMYRAARRLYLLLNPVVAVSRGAALVATLIFVGMGYSVFTGVEVRAYGVLLLLGALSLWLMLRWMQRPNDWRRIGLLGMVLALTIYGSFTSLVFIAFLTLALVILRPRLFAHWMLVGIVTLILLVPLLPQFFANAGERVGRTVQPLPPFIEAMIGQYQAYGGTLLFVGVLAVATILVVLQTVRHRPIWRLVLVMVLWVVVPVGIYFGLGSREFLTPRYVWWVAMGLALLIGAATVFLKTYWRMAVTALAVSIALVPVDFTTYRVGLTGAPPMRLVLSWFAEHIRPGDVLVKDPYCVCGEPIAWDYFLPQFFPEGSLPIVERPGVHARVWYLATTGWQQDEELIKELKQGRRESIFVGPWNFLLRLYEGPPLWDGVTLGGQVNFNGFEIAGNRDTFGENDTIRLKLWWSAETQLTTDYSISVAVFDQFGTLLTQVDGPAQAPDTPQQMTAWQPGMYYEDIRDVLLPPNTPYADFLLAVTVYDWRDGQRLAAPDNPYFGRTGPDSNYLLLRHIHVVSY